MFARWRRLERKTQWQYLFVVAALAIGLYGLLLFPSTRGSWEHSANMVNRRLDRIEKRTVIEEQPSASPVALERDVNNLELRKRELEEQLAALTARFAPLSTSEEQQAQRLALSTLAEQSGLRVLKQGSSGAMARDAGAPPTVRRDPDSDRPIISIEARGSYWALVDFIRAVSELHYVAAPVGIRLAVPAAPAKPPEGAPLEVSGNLEITLNLTL